MVFGHIFTHTWYTACFGPRLVLRATHFPAPVAGPLIIALGSSKSVTASNTTRTYSSSCCGMVRIVYALCIILTPQAASISNTGGAGSAVAVLLPA